MTTRPLTKNQLALYEKIQLRDSHQLLMTRLLAGSSKFTLVSKSTGKRFTFWIRSGANNRDKSWSTNNQNPLFYFVKVLTKPDNSDYDSYDWVGRLTRSNPDSNVVHFDPQYQFKTAPSRFAIEWFLRKVFVVGIIPDDIEIHWPSSCNRCGRELTVPESIQSGYGPECIAHA